MIQGLISFIIGCSILLGITILITKQWYKYVDKKNKQRASNRSRFYSNSLPLTSTTTRDELSYKTFNSPTKRQQRKADAIHKYIDKQIYLNR